MTPDTCLQQFIIRVLSHIKRHRISPTTFGAEAMNDRSFVPRLLAGKEPTLATMRRVIEYMEGK